MRTFGRCVGALALVASGLVAGSASAQLIGDNVTGTFYYPNTSTTYAGPITQTIAAGTVFDFSNTASVTATFGANSIVIQNTSPGAFSPGFNGVDFSFLSGPSIASVVEDASSSSLFAPGSVLTFSANDIRLNLANTCGACKGGEKIILDVTTRAAGAVPESATWAMMILGMGAIGYTMRRKVRRSEEEFDAKIKSMTAGAAA